MRAKLLAAIAAAFLLTVAISPVAESPFVSAQSGPEPVQITDELTLVGGFQTQFNETPQPNAPLGTYWIAGSAINSSDTAFRDIKIVALFLSDDNVVLECDGGVPLGTGCEVSVPDAALGADGVLSPGEAFSMSATIGLNSPLPFELALGATAIPVPVDPAGSFSFVTSFPFDQSSEDSEVTLGQIGNELVLGTRDEVIFIDLITDTFARSLPLEGPTEVVGDNLVSGDSLYDAATGAFITTFSTTPAEPGLGQMIAVDGLNVFFGNPASDWTAPNAGAVFMFDADPASPTFGDLIHVFENPDPANAVDRDDFGGAVAARSGRLLVGAQQENFGANHAGGGYLFDSDPLSPTFGDVLATFVNPTPGVDDRMGWDVEFVGVNPLLGTPFDDTGTSGAAYLFNGDDLSPDFGGLLEPIINQQPHPGSGASFGSVLASNGELIGIPAWRVRSPDDAPQSGITYIFDGDPASSTFGSIIQSVRSPDPRQERFGEDIDMFGDYMVVGSLQEAYLYKFGE